MNQSKDLLPGVLILGLTALFVLLQPSPIDPDRVRLIHVYTYESSSEPAYTFLVPADEAENAVQEELERFATVVGVCQIHEYTDDNGRKRLNLGAPHLCEKRRSG